MNPENTNSVAIIGVKGIFPEADAINDFYHNLKLGKDSVREMPHERLINSVFDPSKKYQVYGYLDRVDLFDHDFFNISKREASFMDPSHKLLLQLACGAIENSGLSLQSVKGKSVGVFLAGKSRLALPKIQEYDSSIFTGMLNGMGAGRISYHLDFSGPSMMIDTACSSSLVAIHEAFYKLINEEVEYAIAGGLSIELVPPIYNADENGIGIAAPDGKSKAFDSKANGTGGGEGGGVVFLKRLDKAIADNDFIHAIIKGSAVNNDGARSNGITAPSPEAQTEVILKAWKNAGVDPEMITFIEAHGTGTKLGDPIEFQAITDAFKIHTNRKNFCALSSLKTNLGHLDNAAGISGLMKCVLSLKHKELFPSLHYSDPNPLINIEDSALFINDSFQPWKSQAPLRCGISSFGLTGTNAHMILEEFVEEHKEIHHKSQFFLKVSAKSAEVLAEYVKNIHDCIVNYSGNLYDLLYTLTAGRDDYKYRIAIASNSKEDLIKDLWRCCNKAESQEKFIASTNRSIVLLLSETDVPNAVLDSICLESNDFKEAFELVKANVPVINFVGEIRVFAIQYALCRTLQKLGVIFNTVVATGVGRITKQVLIDGLSIEQALHRITITDDKQAVDEAKLKNAVSHLISSGHIEFIEVGTSGILLEKIKAMDLVREDNVLSLLLDADLNYSLFKKIAEYYTRGCAVDWNIFYNGIALNKVEAPTYPFARTRCWYADPLQQDEYLSKWFYEYKWVNQHLNAEREVVKGTYILLDSSESLSNRLKQALALWGIRCILVKSGTTFSRLDENAFEMNYGSGVHYQELRNKLSEENISGLIHISSSVDALSSVEYTLTNGLYSHYHFCKHFDDLFAKKDFKYIGITINGREIEKGDDVQAAVGCIHGFFVNMLSEYAGLSGKCIDISKQDLNKDLDHLVEEIMCLPDKILVGYRNGHRYVPAISRIEPPENNFVYVKPNGVYLITGGASGVGLEMVKHLAQQGKSLKLIIVGRRELPVNTSWSKIGEDDKNFPLIKDLLALTENGHEVIYYAGDVSDKTFISETYQKVHENYGKIDGVIHSAGVPGRKRLKDHNSATFKESIDAKIYGSVNLYEVSKKDNLDFFVMFSSTDWIYGQERNSNYGAANLFEELYAQELVRSETETRVKVISWPGWRETGMLARFLGDDLDALNGLIRTSDGLNLFDRVMSNDNCHYVISNNSPELLGSNPYYELDFFSKASNPKVEHKNADEHAIINQDWSTTENKIGSIWREVLKTEKLTLDEDFFEIGGHSINGSQVINRIEKAFNVQLDFEEIFEYSTIRSLATRVMEMIGKGNTSAYVEIIKVKEQQTYPLSHAQRRLLILSQMDGGSNAYNMPGAYVLKGNLDIEAFNRSFISLLERHESLRTVFVIEEGEARQKVLSVDDIGFKVETIDLTKEQNAENSARVFAEAEANKIADLEKGPLLWAKLLKMDEGKYIFLFTLHHIISDGWSQSVLVRDVLYFYDNYSKGLDNQLKPLSIQYKDYASWQNGLLENGQMKIHEDYWLKKLEGDLPVLDLVGDHPRPAVRSYKGSIENDRYDEQLVHTLRKIAEDNGSTLFMVLLTGVKALLYRYTGDNDLIIGSIIAGRDHSTLEDQIGFYVNTLAFRTKLTGSETFTELLSKVKTTTIEGYSHQAYPFDVLVEKLSLTRDMSRNPLFDVVVALQNADVFQRERAISLDVENLDREEVSSKFDLTFNFSEAKDGGLHLSIEYSTDIYDRNRIASMLLHLKSLFETICHNPKEVVRSIDILSVHDKELLLSIENSLALYPSDKSIVSIFEEQVTLYAEKDAVVCKDASITYRDLNEQSNQIGNYLLKKVNVSGNVFIGLLVDRSIDMITGMLGILKAGCAYIPLDPLYPEDRILYLLKDAGISIVLTDNEYWLNKSTEECTFLDIKEENIYNYYAVSKPTVDIHSKDIAYVIYTSGSTGNPKGVLVEHRNLVSLLKCDGLPFAFNESDVWTMFHSMCFDFSVWEIYGALLFGGKLIIVGQDAIKDPMKFVDILFQEGVTVLNQTPSVFEQVSKDIVTRERESDLRLRYVVFGGEALYPGFLLDFKKKFSNVSLVNMYGITETTVHVTYKEILEEDIITGTSNIGKSLPNLIVHILDEYGNPLPKGLKGEIVVGGYGVSRGYHRRDELTKERFKSQLYNSKNLRFYYSGDMGRLLNNGDIEYLGRKDNQVKIRGHRIELGEINAAILSYEGVEQVAVAPKGSSSDKFLNAYLTITPGYLRETELAQGITEEQVNSWENVFENTYAASSEDDPTFNITGWNSAYDNSAIPAEEMRDWVNDIVNKIASYSPKNVLEIGCGTGLLLSRIAPQSERYVGVDLSKEAIAYIKNNIISRGGYEQVELIEGPAHHLEMLPNDFFDTIIINSVVQYFPSIEYLNSVLQEARKLLRADGRIIIGDVRSMSLAHLFYASAQLYKMHTASIELSFDEMKQGILDWERSEKELLIDPDFFITIGKHLQFVNCVEIVAKDSMYENELTKFRYDAVIHFGDKEQHPVVDLNWLDWVQDGGSLSMIKDQIKSDVLMIPITNFPNEKLVRENALISLLDRGEKVNSIDEFKEKVFLETPIKIEDLRFFCKGLGYEILVFWAKHKQNGSLDIFITRNDYAADISAIYYNDVLKGIATKPIFSYANNPIVKYVGDSFLTNLRKYLERKLPEYYIPLHFVIMDKLPLTKNGKIDYKALPDIGLNRRLLSVSYVRPQNRLEQKLCNIWSEILGVEEIGILDNFFDLGGHSLKIMRMISKIHKELNKRIDFAAVFSNPTIQELAVLISGADQSNFERIELAESKEFYKLSLAQKRLWVLQQITGSSLAYNIPGAFVITGTLDKSIFKKALLGVIERHESLRTVFFTHDAEPYQKALSTEEIGFQLEEVNLTDDADAASRVKDFLKEDVLQNFDLEKGPLIRTKLLQLKDKEYIFLLTIHHIISDGWSMGVLLKDLLALYDSYINAKANPLKSLRIQYKDYSEWQNNHLVSGNAKIHETYWLEKLQGELPLIDLPLDQKRQKEQTYNGAIMNFHVDDKSVAALHVLETDKECTLFIILQATVKLLLYKYTGQEDIIVGTPAAGRSHIELEEQIGFYINTLVLRDAINGEYTFNDFIEQVKETTMEAFEHEYPFDMLVDLVGVIRDLSRNPLFDVLVVLQRFDHFKLDKSINSDLDIRVLEQDTVTSKFDLSFYFQYSDKGNLTFHIEYNTDLFDSEKINDMGNHFVNLLSIIPNNLNLKFKQLSVFSDSRELRMLNGISELERTTPVRRSIHALVEEQASAFPHQIAIFSGDTQLTFMQLNQEANRIANFLIAVYGITPETKVGIMMSRSDRMIIAMLAILKSGAAYVPIDPAYPEQRINYIIEDSEVKIVLTEALFKQGFKEDTNVVLVDTPSFFEEYSALNPITSVSPSNLAYIIYTSGSTGKPKGVMIEHRNAVAFIMWCKEEFAKSRYNVCYASTSYCFDLSIFEIFYVLSVGKPIRILQSALEIPEFLRKDTDVLINTVPSVVDSLLKFKVDLSHVSVLNMAGEAVPYYFKDVLDYERIEVRNLYGPSEDTTYSTCYRFDSKHSIIPIGKPISNTQILILDKERNLTPIGVKGEIYIAGEGIARGYYNKQELTNERFIDNPFIEGGKLYRTGDLGKWLWDGNIDYIGREDDQVKIRGYRIELAEIEYVMSKLENVHSVVVTANKDAEGTSHLVAYVVLQALSETPNFRELLLTLLPDYMVPTYFVYLNEIPLTPNGKVDRKALPIPENSLSSLVEYVSPQTETEEALCEIWKSLLSIDQIGVKNNFFDLGGHSLKGLVLVSAIYRKMNVKLELRSIFLYPTIESLAKHIDTLQWFSSSKKGIEINENKIEKFTL